MPVNRFVLVIPLILLAACSPTRRVYEVTEVDRPPDVLSDSLEIEVRRARVTYIRPERSTPDVSPQRSVDVISTVLDLSFDFAERTVHGTAEVRIISLSDGLESFYLHAVGMEIHRVESLLETGRGALPVTYAYDGLHLTITPSRPLRFDESLRVRISYTAHPMETSGQSGLSFSGFGLYFIDPEGTDPHRPTQIWTQGQTEDNQRWFPTWDYPDDKQTFDIALTVPDNMRTFGNGEMVESAPAGPGLRRDRWVLDTYPTSSYLAAFVIGDFAAVEDEYIRDDSTTVPLLYIVEPEYADDALRIFGETPDMIRVYEEETGVRYPWPNYKQAVVRDFTAGGMENTTLTVLTERVQTDERGYLDYNARDLIAHELAHQWFGDFTTAKDWANLAINESFASYMEEIYLEAAFGRDEAQAHGIEDRIRYFEQAESLRRPIVWYGYAQEGQMFDRHTYQKGGQVLNQLRFELGDETWRRGLHKFLTGNAGQPVEVDDLRDAMEAVSGRSLRRFFSQWFYNPGHPTLDVEQAYFPGSDLYTVQVIQTQSRSEEPIFAFDVNVELNYADAPRELHRLRVVSADTTFRFTVPEQPTFVRFDEGNWILADITLTMPVEELVKMAVADDEMAGRYDAIEALAARADSPVVREALVRALRDTHPLVRRLAAESLETYLRSPGVAEALVQTARDEDPEVRLAAINVLGGTESDGLLEPVLRSALADSSYRVVAEAVGLLAERFPGSAFEAYQAESLFELTSWAGTVEQALIQAVATLDAEEGGMYVIARADLDNPDDVRVAAVDTIAPLALNHVGLRGPAREALRDHLADRLQPVRLHAAEGFGLLGVDADIEQLEEQLELESDDEVKDALQAALQQIRGRASGTQIGR
ncbi:MAG: HEAT repeat domain-containing protein [Bacteroidetes bacterium]|nr:HEAT repeat domain-containing protein [Bacteroidota bacterium]